MKERKRHIRIGAGAVIFFVVFCILGSAIGTWINSHIHLREIKKLDSSQFGEPF